MITALLMASCHHRGGGDGGSPLNDPGLMKEASIGLENQFNVLRIPTGDVEIFSPAKANLNPPDVAKKQFPGEYYDYLRWLESKGLVKLDVKENLTMSVTDRSGTITVTPTEMTLKAANHRLGDGDWLVLKMAHCEVTRITFNASCQPLKTAGSDDTSSNREYRIVEGVYHAIPGDLLKTIEPAIHDADYKFRAKMRFKPESNKYEYMIGDWGAVDSPTWKTSNIRMVTKKKKE